MSGSGGTEIAVVGMAGRFPGAKTIDAFWQNLREGVESRTELSDEALAASGVDAATLADPRYVKSAMVLPDLEMFDAAFFGFSPRDASIMDPQHRHFLECAWEALENAGHVPRRFPGSIAIFAGSGHNAYLPLHLMPNRELMESVGFFLLRHTGNDKDFLTTRASYLFDLTGPSVNVQTACSTSLVAIHMACQSLLSRECDMALAGGVTIELPHRRGYRYREGEILSPDGHCRAFDARSQGTVFGSGVGVVVLRRLDDALAAGDFIHAVILGSAVNNDGSTKVGYLAPSVDGQAQAVAEAIGMAGIDADAITYVEAHGTGTPVGDPIEIAALTQAFRETTERRRFCAIGSVKTNIGHLDTAAGVAGFIKAALALQHRQIPPSLHFERANPSIDFEDSPFHVVSRLTEWTSEGPRRAAVNSLGVGGTNAYVILEEAPERSAPAQPRPFELLVISARTPAALDAASLNLGRHLREHDDIALAGVAYTCQAGRRAFTHRRAVVARDREHAAAALVGEDPSRILSHGGAAGEPEVAFMFPGGGAQHLEMGRDLYRFEPAFRAEVDRCADILRTHEGLDLLPVLYPAHGAPPGAELVRTSMALPALFTIELALAKLLMSWGVRPRALIGHSLGEYAAACLSGVLSLEEAMSLVALRSRLFEAMPEGAMVSVPLSEDALRGRLGAHLSIAAVNAPSLCTVSGPIAAIVDLEAALAREDITTHRLHISVAAHSAMLSSILGEFAAFAKRLRPRAMTIPYVSNVTGTWMTAEDAADPLYWVKHLRHTVRFADGVSELCATPNRLLLEVGPGTTLAALARQHPKKTATHTVLSSMRHPQDAESDLAVLLGAIGRLWTAGVDIDWSAFSEGKPRRRVPLPTYPFEHKRYWIDPPSTNAPAHARASSRREDVGDWFYRPCWRRSPPRAPRTAPVRVLVLGDSESFCARLVARLRSDGHDVTVASARHGFTERDSGYTVDPGRRDDYFALIRDLAANGGLPARIVHAFCFGTMPQGREAVNAAAHRGLLGLMYLAQAIGAEDPAASIEITVLVDGLQAAGGTRVVSPEKALLLGPALVIPREYPNMACRVVDIAPSVGPEDEGLAQVCREIAARPGEAVVAYRGAQRFVRGFSSARIEEGGAVPLKHKGVYLVTGGLGGIGLEVAQHLAKTVAARLVLVGRTGLPRREQWSRWLELHAPNDWTSRLITRVRALESAGAEVMVAGVDVADEAEVRRLVARAISRFGRIDGVFHAAGVLRDGLIQDKDKDAVDSVLGPKVWGTLALDAALAGTKLDFFVLFSSVSALSGLAGQVDYAAANAFLGAYAEARCAAASTRTIAIDWSAWQEVGMAAELARELGLAGADPEHGEPFAHPLLKRRSRTQDGRDVFSGTLGIEHDWILREHRLSTGDALLPGTAYLDLARAGFAADLAREALSSKGTLELRNTTFLSPFVVRDGEAREIRLEITREGDTAEFVVRGRSEGGAWTDHARGHMAFVEAPPPRAVDLSVVAARCRDREEVIRGVRRDAHVVFGPRWGALEKIAYGSREAVITIELPAAFADDLVDYALHPAMLDLATASAQSLMAGPSEREFYVPFSYGCINVREPLPKRIMSHVRLRTDAASAEVIAFDVTIVDDRGVEIVSIVDFTMRRVGDAGALTAPKRRPAFIATQALEMRLKDGIAPSDGIEALDRVLAGGIGPRLVVSPRDLEAVLDEDRRGAEMNGGASDTPSATSAEITSRPSSAYAAPRTDLERLITGLLGEMLGVAKVGIHDDFFEIGGHSLLAVRLFNRLHKHTGVNLPLATLFCSPTAAQLARSFGGGDPESERAEPESTGTALNGYHRVQNGYNPWSSLVALQPEGSRLPFFCVHGRGGNVLNYAALAPHLGRDQPLFGLQSRGLDGSAEPFRDLVEMASHYISEIRAVQPHGPYFLGGGSMGGTIAYEMARQLRAAGDRVGLVAMFDTYGPHHFEFAPSALVTRARTGVLGRVERRIDNMRALGARQQIVNIKSLVVGKVEDRVKGTATFGYRSMGLPVPHSLRYWDLQKTNLDILGSYVPKPYPGKVVLFRAREQPRNIYSDPSLGWSGWAQGGVEVIDIPGTHDNNVEQPKMVAELRAALDRAFRDTPS